MIVVIVIEIINLTLIVFVPDIYDINFKIYLINIIIFMYKRYSILEYIQCCWANTDIVFFVILIKKIYAKSATF